MDELKSAVDRRSRGVEAFLVAGALLLALLGARPYAGGWNDGSRLATVESLVDQHTWSIDHSTFVCVPPPRGSGTPLPYDPAEANLLQHGTLDRLFIDGHYYSDKSPVPALLLAGWYQLRQAITGETAREHPDRFCRAMTLASSGLAYVVAVLCIFRLGRTMRLPLHLALLLTSSFALATVALPYVQHVNNHILLLGVTAPLVLGVARVREDNGVEGASWKRFVSLGALAGLGYTVDLGVGPVLLLATFVLILTQCQRRLRAVLLFALAALPWLVLHHALNYRIGGTFKPANANPDYFCWPGSPFAAHNLTGRWIHDNPFAFLLYAASMLAGKRGFLGHNLPLFLTIPALVILLRRHRDLRPQVLWAAACCGGTWLLYAATSNNSSGQCCTIRWFVPLLAPAYYLLGLLLQRHPRHAVDLAILSSWGMLMVFLMREGPWIQHMVRGFWPIQAVALGSWLVYRRWPAIRGRLASLFPVSTNRSVIPAD